MPPTTPYYNADLSLSFPLSLRNISPSPPIYGAAAQCRSLFVAPLARFACASERARTGMEGEKGAAMEAEAVELQKTSRFRRICVFCGSQPGKKTSYQEAAVELGKELVKSGIDLVYGGGSVGLMGLVSRAVHEGGRHVLGVITRSLMPNELSEQCLGEVLTVSDMHERKAEMARQADAFIALPGGYRTLEELLEVITWAQLGIHKKPVGLLNVDGFYDSLLLFLDMAVGEGFISQAARDIIIYAPTAKELIKKLEDYVPEYETSLVWEAENKPLELIPEPETGMA